MPHAELGPQEKLKPAASNRHDAGFDVETIQRASGVASASTRHVHNVPHAWLAGEYSAVVAEQEPLCGLFGTVKVHRSRRGASRLGHHHGRG